MSPPIRPPFTPSLFAPPLFNPFRAPVSPQPTLDGARFFADILTRERTTRLASLERRADLLRQTVSAIGAFEAPAASLRRAADTLRSPAFAGVDLKVSSSDTTVLSGAAESGASPGSSTVGVSALASKGVYDVRKAGGSYTSADEFLAPELDDSAPLKARQLSLTLGTDVGAEVVAIEITSKTTLNDVVNAFNAASSRAAASTINVGTAESPNVHLVFQSNETGESTGAVGVDIGDALVDPNQDGDTNDNVFGKAELTQAQNARLTVPGIGGAIERGSNTITDVLPGVTLNLTGLGTATVTVSADSSKAAAAVSELVSTFNGVASFVRSANNFPSGALRATTVDELTVQAVREGLHSARGSTGISLADVGVTTDGSGALEFNEVEFRAAAAASPSGVNSLVSALGESLGGVGGTVDRFDGSPGLIGGVKRRTEDRLRDYESRISRLEGLIADSNAAAALTFGRLETALTRLSTQRDILASLFGPPR